ncbi:unnamed protein product [Auanema sp. JU1783]|nr:unnamed protein product [Auanema sp. JU1783]
MTFTSTELNCLIWKYLQEAGFSHTAFIFSKESHLDASQINTEHIISGALPTLVQKGLFYTEAELCTALSDENEKASVPTLSLIEAVTCDITEKKKREKESEEKAIVVQEETPVVKADSPVPAACSPKIEWGKKTRNRNERIQTFSKNEVRFLKSHASEVFICAWNPKNELLASGSGDATVKLWDLTQTHDLSVQDQYFSSNTTVLKHSSEDVDYNPKNKDVTSMDWNPCGDHIATGCYDGYARIWNSKGHLRCVLGKHNGPIFALKWNARGDYVLSAGVDKTTAIWDAFKGCPIQHFTFHEQSALDVDWITNEMFASCSTDRTIIKCQLGSEVPLLTLTGHRGEVNAIRYDPISGRLASCSDDKAIKIWDIDEGYSLKSWEGHEKEIYTIRWSPNGRILASASFDHTVRLWNIADSDAYQILSKHTDPVYSVSFSPDGRYVATGCFDRSIYVWDVQSGKQVITYNGDKDEGGIFDVNWNNTGEKIAGAASDGTIILLDTRCIRQ